MIPDFPATYSRLLVRELQLDAAGTAALLDGSGVSAQELFRLDARLPLAAQARIIRNALALAGDPALGLAVGAHMPHAAHGALGVAISSAATARAGLAVLERFQALRIPVLVVRARDAGADVVIEIDSQLPADAVGLFLTEAYVASILGVMGLPAGGDAGDVAFAHAAPAHAARYATLLRRPVRFGAERTAVRLPAALLDAPNPFADPEVHAEALRQCERLLADRSARDSWSARVTRLLQQHPGQRWTAPEVAAALHVSGRSLLRHLRAEGTGYQALLDAELYRQAQQQLERPGQTVAAVAAALGYEDVAAFRRAFKRWTGMPPRAWQGQR